MIEFFIGEVGNKSKKGTDFHKRGIGEKISRNLLTAMIIYDIIFYGIILMAYSACWKVEAV